MGTAGKNILDQDGSRRRAVALPKLDPVGPVIGLEIDSPANLDKSSRAP